MTGPVALIISWSAIAVLAMKVSWVSAFQYLDFNIIFKTTIFTVGQAILSALFCVVIGVLAAPGYAGLGSLRKYFRWILLLPNMMSSVLVVLVLLLAIPNFPFGVTGIIIGHLFINVGFSTIILGEALLELESHYRRAAESCGAHSLRYWRKVAMPLMMPTIKSLFVVLFSFCLSSFAIPLILGGGPQYATLEVLIFEKIRTEGDVAAAVLLGLWLSALQGICYLVMLKSFASGRMKVKSNLVAIRISWATGLTSLVFAFSLWPLWHLIAIAKEKMANPLDDVLKEKLLGAIGTSASIAFLVALTVCGFLVMFLNSSRVQKWIFSVPTLSGVVIGLAGILVFGNLASESWVSLVLICVLCHFALIYFSVLRLFQNRLEWLKAKYEMVLLQLGTSRMQKARKVYLPLGISVLVGSFLIGFCWSMGEFTVSSQLIPSGSTLPLLVSELLGSYRLEMASLVGIILLGVSALSVFVLEWIVFASSEGVN